MSKSEIKRIEITVRAEIEAELREQIAQEIEGLPKFKSTNHGMVEDDFGHYIYIDKVLQAIERQLK